MLRVLYLFAIAVPVFAGPRANWSGPYQPCLNRNQLLRTGHMSIGVRFDTTNPVAAVALRKALHFWSTVLDVEFHEDASQSCALAIVDATGNILTENNDVARAQFTDWDNFQGWIAFDPHISEYMSSEEIYATAIHELGHIFGLVHNSHPSSVMYYIDADGSSVLDEVDLDALRARHTLRPAVHGPVPIDR
ncbi:MAG: matrixin family metalloprotease [Acidobacteriaceae bacterium]|nr:matrixin family metalloprotease [Acidobacteriaceae bacterium]